MRGSARAIFRRINLHNVHPRRRFECDCVRTVRRWRTFDSDDELRALFFFVSERARSEMSGLRSLSFSRIINLELF